MNDQDKELVKMAAKACGITNYTELIECEWSDRQPARNNWGVYMGPNSYAPWNPLLDDGDALRLAVDVGMRHEMVAIALVNRDTLPGVTAQCHKLADVGAVAERRIKQDPHAAMRSAIVGMAAEIGRSMP